MTMISIVKHLSPDGGKDLLMERQEGSENDEKQSSFWEFTWADRYVKSPDSRTMTLWTALALSINTMSIFIVYYEAAFRLVAWEKESPWVYALEFVLLFEIIIFFFKAYPAEENHRGWLLSVLGFCGLCKEKIKIEV